MSASSVDHLYDLDRRFPSKSEQRSLLHLWVPSERVTVHRINKPTAPQRKWPALIPWMLEERTLEPVEETHFVLGGRADGDLVDVFAVSRHDMQEWHRIAENAGVVAMRMVPDYFALPWEDGRITIGWREGRCLVRHSATQGFAASPEVAWAMVERLIAAQDVAPRVSISVPDPELIPQSLRIQAEINDAEVDWQMTSMPSSVNLMSGIFQARPPQPEKHIFVVNTLLTILAIGLLFVYLELSNANLAQHSTALENHLKVSFSRVFPSQSTDVEDLRFNVQQKIARLERQYESVESMPLRGLLALTELMANCGCDLRLLQTSGQEVELHVENAAALKRKKLVIQGYTVTMRPLYDVADAYIVKLRPEGTS